LKGKFSIQRKITLGGNWGKYSRILLYICIKSYKRKKTPGDIVEELLFITKRYTCMSNAFLFRKWNSVDEQTMFNISDQSFPWGFD
jgi:hypothetical protein